MFFNAIEQTAFMNANLLETLSNIFLLIEKKIGYNIYESFIYYTKNGFDNIDIITILFFFFYCKRMHGDMVTFPKCAGCQLEHCCQKGKILFFFNLL